MCGLQLLRRADQLRYTTSSVAEALYTSISVAEGLIPANNSADKLSCPVLLLQGADDKVVPPNQVNHKFTCFTSTKVLGLLV